MKKAQIQNGKELYHFTALANLPSILGSRLLPRKELEVFVDVADKEILEGRDNYSLDKMVPFHFFANNPFDGKVCQLNPQEKFAFIAVRRAVAEANQWKITPKHPLSGEFSLLPYGDGIKAIDWDIMNEKDFKATESKLTCMAECLSPIAVAPSFFHAIYVATKEDEALVKKLVEKNGLKMFVETKPYLFPSNYLGGTLKR